MSRLSETKSTPKKGDLIINPNTQRAVKVGGGTWRSLVKAGTLPGHYTDSNVIEKYDELDEEKATEKIREINKKLPKGEQAVRGRGRFKGQIVKKKKKMGIMDASLLTAKAAARAFTNNLDELIESEGDIEELLERMIMAEMMSKPMSRKKTRPNGGSSHAEPQYLLEEDQDEGDETCETSQEEEFGEE